MTLTVLVGTRADLNCTRIAPTPASLVPRPIRKTTTDDARSQFSQFSQSASQ